MDSHPGDLPEETTEQSTELPWHSHLLNKGSFLMTGPGGQWRLLDQSLDPKTRRFLILQNPFQQNFHHPLNNYLPPTIYC